MQEIWKKISGHEKYSVSNLGRVRNDDASRLLCPIVRSSTCPYLSVLLCKNGKSIHKNVHSLVAEAFCEKASGNLVVNHKDGNKHNNRADNLEWVTRSENDKHAFRMGLRHSTSEQISEAINSRKRGVINITLGKEYESIADAARAIGGQHSGVAKCLSGQRETYYGMKFAYLE